LGRKYVDKVIDEKQYELLIMTEDFKGRSVLKIIIERNLFELMQESDPKAENLMIKIFQGKDSAKCDGDIFGYSCLTHLVLRKPKNIAG